MSLFFLQFLHFLVEDLSWYSTSPESVLHGLIIGKRKNVKIFTLSKFPLSHSKKLVAPEFIVLNVGHDHNRDQRKLG